MKPEEREERTLNSRVHVMVRTVYIDNWRECVLRLLDELLLNAGQRDKQSPENLLLLWERQAVQEMIRQVSNVDADLREEVSSPLIAASARETLDVPDHLLNQVGEVHDVYRRYRKRLTWA